MKFFAVDCHIGIRDIQQIFEDLGHELDVWSISDHAHIMGWERKKVDVIGDGQWWKLTPEMCNAFYARYKNELAKYDGFVVFYPPAFSMLYEQWGKPIIMQVPIKYEVPFSFSADKWNYFNNYLQRKIDEGILFPIANGLYDKYYCGGFIGRKFELIPNYCGYTGAEYTGKKDDFVYWSRVDDFRVAGEINRSTLGGCEWQDIADYRGVVHYPYHNNLMSAYEQYTQNVPMLFPSHKFIVELREKHGMGKIMSELSWGKIFNEPGVALKFDRLDPNSQDDLDAFCVWSTFCDWYDNEWMPHIIHFDSFEDLRNKKLSTNFADVSAKMREHNKWRKAEIYRRWETLLNKI